MNSKCAVEEEKWFPKLLAKYEGVIAMNGESRVLSSIGGHLDLKMVRFMY